MKLSLFKKNKDNDPSRKVKKEQGKKALETLEEGEAKREELEAGYGGLSAEALAKAGATAHKILKGFYVSEKASLGNSMGQYSFKVFENANKSEIKKEIARLFDVKVKKVKILNSPEKRRDFGRHPGTKSGFKKAVVILEKGHTIGQAR